ncbi:LPS export ABC transporter periplasmic protein LptC [Pseudorhodobacter aquimaris]|uniref:LPS export ABC transporter periplasmic protein LptC n=1 Tax=Pseudorhodobacter aquimaris TaxID=687412 RepID=UPI00067C8D96|nr:LPS export ABC transporter periplasmic protein LptC [Pseudorhodobacter aquimaris]
MRRDDNFHSTAVAWLKVALPLLALAILSTLFLVARTVDPSDAIPFAEVDIEDRVREPRLTQPTWAGVTDDGAALTISADEARPQQGDALGASANALVLDLQTPDGGRANLVAGRGMLDSDQGVLLVDGGVTVTTSTGYEVTTDAMRAALDRTSLISETPVTGTAPAGQITAGAMEISQQPDAPGQYLLVFKNGVRLLYTPTGK